MIADSIDEGAKSLWLPQTAVFAQDCEDACKCLLAHIFNCLWGMESRPQLHLKQSGEVRNKMLLRLTVACAKSFYVSGIERMKLQS
jgi:hypothetical protein